MGIKGIYGEIGPGERVALTKLAIEKFEQTGRPFRIAIDVSIWQFQTLAGQGGSNPAVRTFYYRLLRLLSTSIQPLFVFDGPHKPPFKRGKKTGQHGASVPNMLTKQLLKLFGFPFHTAPGEAEAECALFQREGIVDAVLSEDVDTLMFGSTLTLRNWSSEGLRGNKSPTHVSVYDSKATKDGNSGLDREGMVLVALMSGGDYITEGIPGCGIKIACEAARAGYGKSLCRIPRSDAAALETWRANLAREVQTNKSKHFKMKHKALKIPENFPNKEVLGYYTHPVVSNAAKVQRLKEEILWDGEVDVQALRKFVADAFDWTHKIGAVKFIRGLAPALLVHKLRARGSRRDSGYGDVVLTAMNEMELVRAICGTRKHFTTDALPELRVVYLPTDIVGLDLEEEEDDSADYGRDGLAPLLEDDQIEGYVSDDAVRSASPSKRGPSAYDPTQPDKAWIPETIAKIGVPLKVEDYEESFRDPKKYLKAKHAAKRAATKKPSMPKGTLDKFVKISKPGVQHGNDASEALKETAKSGSSSLPPVFLAPTLEGIPSTQPAAGIGLNPSTRPTRRSARSNTESSSSKPTAVQPWLRKAPNSKTQAKASTNTNPWTLAASQTSPPSGLHRITKAAQHESESTPTQKFKHQVFNIDSSPLVPPLSPSPRMNKARKYEHSPSPTHPSPPLETDLGKNFPNSVIISRHRSRSKQNNLDTPSRSPSRPSPRKKISPDQGREFVPAKPLSPEPVARKINFQAYVPKASPAMKGSEDWDRESSRSVSPELPSVSDLLPSREASQCVQPSPAAIPISISGTAPKTTTRTTKIPTKTGKEEATKIKPKKKYIMLRESLPGGWKEVEEDEESDKQTESQGKVKGKEKVKPKPRAWRYSQVEVFDLSAE